jgi:hypothetical protein
MRAGKQFAAREGREDQQGNSRHQNPETQHHTPTQPGTHKDARAYGWRSVNRSRYRRVDGGLELSMSSPRKRGPIRRELSIQAWWATTFLNHNRLWLWVPAFAGTTWEDSIFKPLTRLRIPATQCARGLLLLHAPLRKRAQGKPGARCTRGLACKKDRKAHTSIQVQRKHSGLPCAMVLRLMSSSPRRSGFLVTVACENRFPQT